ncbi:MAG: hypothetical protein K6B28_05335 [Lachnospiraceae bacterium]|nr:hypothetical protein [Lachnospiraceae bacterium]
MKKVIVVYDDSRIPEREIKSITGSRSFGNTIFKRISLRERIKNMLISIPYVSGFYMPEDILERVASALKDAGKTPVFRFFSDFFIEDSDSVSVLIEKACYINEIYCVISGDRVAAVMYPDVESYKENLQESDKRFERIESDAFVDLSDVNNFRRFITGGFDARFFNSLESGKYTVVKRSSNKEKIRAEYEYYRLLPEEMKMWYAVPFGYKESEKDACYSMERFFVTDLALRYVHGAIDEEEFRMIMDKLFYFIKNRSLIPVTSERYQAEKKALYIDKVDERINRLRELEQFEILNGYIRTGTDYDSIDDIVNRYKRLYSSLTSKMKADTVLVVGHGDLCFSNILYNRDIDLLKLIDPKGALTEDKLYTDPCYDICKLSHSVMGEYDYFNSDLFGISIGDDMKLKLSVDSDNKKYKDIFKEYLLKNGFDPDIIRIYETSLFLSMLPLHIDRVKKVMGFILNAVRIMDELEG